MVELPGILRIFDYGGVLKINFEFLKMILILITYVPSLSFYQRVEKIFFGPTLFQY